MAIASNQDIIRNWLMNNIKWNNNEELVDVEVHNNACRRTFMIFVMTTKQIFKLEVPCDEWDYEIKDLDQPIDLDEWKNHKVRLPPPQLEKGD